MQKSLAEMNRLGKELVEISSTDERVIELTKEIEAHKDKNRELAATLSQTKGEVEKLKGDVSRFTEYMGNLERWFSRVKEFLVRKKIFKEFEQFMSQETEEKVREYEIEEQGLTL